jgi:3-oxoacyl-[acyl-carrier protein] reductase
MKKLALITGGTSGIGLGAAKILAHQFDLALSYAGNTEKAAVASNMLSAHHPESHIETFALALHDYDSCTALHNRVVERFGKPVSVLINCAGKVRDGLFMSTEFAAHHAMIMEHLTVSMALSHLVIKEMYKQKFGRIINFSSITASRAKRGQVNYTAVKAGIEGFTKALALEVAHRGITVNAIAPGLINTPMTAGLLQQFGDDAKAIKGKIPAGYIGEPDDVAQAINFLCSEHARYITGQTITIDGGRSLGEI